MKAIYLRFHRWRGFGPGVQGDLFSVSRQFGFVTLYLCRECLVERFQKLRATVDEIDRMSRDNPERTARHWDGR